MKRISLIIALALCLTVSGVYATWNYITNETKASVSTTALGIGMADVNSEASIFTSTISLDNLYLVIDEIRDRTGEGTVYTTYPVIASDEKGENEVASINVNFDISATAQKSTTIQAGTYTLEVSLEVVNASFDDDTEDNESEKLIFAGTAGDGSTFPVQTHTLQVVVDENASVTDGSNLVISADEILTALGMNDFILETEDEYNQFKTVLATTSINIVIEQTSFVAASSN